MTDEDGNIVKVALLCCCEIDSGEYALMLPIEENGKEYCQEDCDFIVFRMVYTTKLSGKSFTSYSIGQKINDVYY